ncbi:hypothetical protein LOZ61_003254 [Ophidiomyces ophidiicola]|nr:hypothetical protein LOZ61_003254 [Ophidiomyces ophidiicola]KAI1959255.1 hypothetical protein LOZ59_003175 [Ophidiomyces ophidiicola]KAI2014880.1 hypothetical protein LOZ49_001107 [Ophidiomyces ophidiicola]KAI2027633.1 hypothetical protein LOZ48_004629 [Ophidiomyces ophidiicola]KAI2049376.1 hypothetical protein LOZ44_003777 [Ophidiomyces ophidiicola]
MGNPLEQSAASTGSPSSPSKRWRYFFVFALLALCFVQFTGCQFRTSLRRDGPDTSQTPTGQLPMMWMTDQKRMATPGELTPLNFEPLPLGAIKPRGWLLEEAKAMVKGLPGHEYDFYQVVRDSRWLGGSRDYSDLNEALPYWFNGVVPLAYETGDEDLLGKVRKIADYVISHQQDDGWLGPETEHLQRNFWGRTPLVMGLAQMAEAEPGTKIADDIMNSMHRFLDIMHSMLSDNLQGLVAHPGDKFDEQWGRSRASDMILVLQWLYERDPRDNEGKLLDCMEFFRKGGHDWSWWYGEDVYPKVDFDTLPDNFTNKYYHFEHGVNIGQGLKSSAIIRRFTHDDGLLESARRGVDLTFKYHGTPSGGVIADERLSGLSPVRGVELCSVVETMYSLSYLYQATGEKGYADRCELAAFNALPVMVTTDWWAHQYIAQTNQPISHIVSRSPWHNVGTNAQTFGLEPNYPCCTVNYPQGYPKFISNMFVRAGDDGIAHALLGPGSVETTTKSGNKVKIACSTAYPFSHAFWYDIESEDDFTFHVRVPKWAETQRSWFSVDGSEHSLVSPDSQNGLQAIYLRGGKHVITYSLDTGIRTVPRDNNTVSIYHGALLYAVALNPDVTYKQSTYPGAPPLAREYTMTPRKNWGLAIDPSSLRFKGLPDPSKPLPGPVWGEGNSVTTITATVCDIEWDLTEPRGHAPNPPHCEKRVCVGKPYQVELVPYGTAKLHMAELPVMKSENGCVME